MARVSSGPAPTAVRCLRCQQGAGAWQFTHERAMRLMGTPVEGEAASTPSEGEAAEGAALDISAVTAELITPFVRGPSLSLSLSPLSLSLSHGSVGFALGLPQLPQRSSTLRLKPSLSSLEPPSLAP
jgi:hypothetical protein